MSCPQCNDFAFVSAQRFTHPQCSVSEGRQRRKLPSLISVAFNTGACAAALAVAAGSIVVGNVWEAVALMLLALVLAMSAVASAEFWSSFTYKASCGAAGCGE